MDIPLTLHQQITEFLTNIPNIHDSSSQQAFLNSAGLDGALFNQIRIDRPPIEFVELLLSNCIKYGRLQDGRHALEAILEVAKQRLGADKQIFCDQLLQDFRTLALQDISDLLREANLKELREQCQPLDIYLTTLQKRHSTMRIFGLPKPVPLNNIYVHVNILEKPSPLQRSLKEHLEASFRENRSFGRPLKERHDGLGTVREHNYLFILGKPGSGKTTFLKSLVLQAIEGHLKRIPIFISLKEFSTSGDTLEKCIGEQFDGCGFSDIQSVVKDLFNTGQVLLLCDGLDEVTQEGNVRYRVISALNALMEKYHTNQYIITCRIAATEYVFEQYTYVEIADFGDLQIQQFMKQWFNDKTKQSQFLQEFRKYQGLNELAQTPLLLSFLCVIFEELHCFPSKRSQLYEEAIDILLKKWDSSRGIVRDEVYKQLSLKRKHQMFSQIAFDTFEKGEYIIEQKTIEKTIAKYLNQDVDEEVILKAIEAQHGILVERAKGLYSYLHLTFQEYFTARYIVENAHKDTLQRFIQQHCFDMNWHGVFLLMTEMLDDADEFFEIFVETLDESVRQNGRLKAFLVKVEREANDLQINAPLIIKRRYTGFRILYTAFKFGFAADSTAIHFDHFDFNDFAAFSFTTVSDTIAFAAAIAAFAADTNAPYFDAYFTTFVIDNVQKAIEISQQQGLLSLAQTLQQVSIPSQKNSTFWSVLFKTLFEIFSTHLSLTDYAFTKDQGKSLTKYFQAVELLLRCSKNAYMADKEAIMQRLLRVPPKKNMP